jgi:hypothetical protein
MLKGVAVYLGIMMLNNDRRATVVDLEAFSGPVYPGLLKEPLPNSQAINIVH